MLLLCSRWLPESSRWLLLHGKSQQAVQNLRKVAMINGRKEEGERLTTEVSSCVGGSSFWLHWDLSVTPDLSACRPNAEAGDAQGRRRMKC